MGPPAALTVNCGTPVGTPVGAPVGTTTPLSYPRLRLNRDGPSGKRSKHSSARLALPVVLMPIFSVRLLSRATSRNAAGCLMMNTYSIALLVGGKAKNTLQDGLAHDHGTYIT